MSFSAVDVEHNCTPSRPHCLGKGLTLTKYIFNFRDIFSLLKESGVARRFSDILFRQDTTATNRGELPLFVQSICGPQKRVAIRVIPFRYDGGIHRENRSRNACSNRSKSGITTLTDSLG